MLVMTGAGLDAMLKQIAHDALRDVLAKSVKAQKEFSQFAVREMSSEGEELQLKTIAEYLVSDSPRERLLKRWEEEITSRSMQSVEQIMTVAGYLGVEKPREVLTTNTKKIQDAFDVRNQIAHEMDIDFSHPVRKRRPRRREHMVDHVNALVSVCADILSHMDSTLK